MSIRVPLTARSDEPKSARDGIDHASRLVSRYFDVADKELIVGGLRVSDLVRDYGSPLFIYDRGVIRSKIATVRQVLDKRFSLFYSIKANPNKAILTCVLDAGCGLEIASAGELFQALDAGCPPQHIIFAGPGKTEAELAAAIDAAIGEIHVESIEEARTIERLAAARDRVCNIALRVNPVDSAGGAMRMGGKASPFGIDEEDLDRTIDDVKALRHLRVTGLHLFMGTQILDADVLIGQYRRAVSLARQVAELVGPLQTLDFGGGWGTPYFAHEQELDLAAVRAGIASISGLMEADPLLAETRAIVEPGRFLVNEAGLYVARVTRVKRSRGKTFAVLDGGMHHHLAASGNLGQAIKRNFPLAVVNKLGQPPSEAIEVVGPLCTPLDTLGRNLCLPAMEEGDLVAVFQSGAYARTSSPLGFLSHDSPAEIMVDNGRADLIRRRGKPQDLLHDQVIAQQSRGQVLSP